VTILRRYHPDISTASDAAAKFISIQEAYNILTGKARGKETGPQYPSSQGSWDFHDWCVFRSLTVVVFRIMRWFSLFQDMHNFAI
jgi:hypothetical protein